MPSINQYLSEFRQKIKAPFGIAVKGVESNRLPVPQGDTLGSSRQWDWTQELIAAIRGISTRKEIDWRKEAGDFRRNSIVSLCQNWIGTSFPQAVPRVGKIKNGVIEPGSEIDNHPLVKLLRRPNREYTGKWLHWALTSDWFPTGNAYCHIVTDGRNNLSGNIVELEWLPSDYMEPKASKSTGRLDHFEYNPDGTIRHIDPKEIIHFRFGVDQLNPLKGLSPLIAQDRFIVADNSGAAYSAGLLLHGGIPPALIVPEPPTPGALNKALTADEAEQLTDMLAEKFKSDPGKIRFLSNAVKLLMLGYKPSEMALNELLEEPETRIPAAYGIPPEVIKVRVGLLHSTENNIKEARKAAWDDCVGPCQDDFADYWTTRVLWDRMGTEEMGLYYDRSKIGVLQPDMSALRKDAATLYTAGVFDRAKALKLSGEDPAKEDEGVYAKPGGDGIQDPATDPNNPANQNDPNNQKPPAQKKTILVLNER